MRKGERTKEHILEKSKELFIEKGYAATTMEDLVRYTGMSKGSIYYHFKSKEDLFFGLIEHNAREWNETWYKKRDEYAGPIEQIYGLAYYYVHEFQNPFVKVTEEFTMNNPIKSWGNMDRLLASINAPRSSYEEVLREGQSQGLLRNDIDASRLAIILAGLLDGLSSTLYEQPYEMLQDLYKVAIDCFLQGARG